MSIDSQDVLVGIEILYAVGGLISAVILALWRLFAKYAKIEHQLNYLQSDASKDDRKFAELLRKIDAISEELTKMRLEMLSAHNEISERVIRVEAKS